MVAFASWLQPGTGDQAARMLPTRVQMARLVISLPGGEHASFTGQVEEHGPGLHVIRWREDAP
ncbi:MAG TPA: hypothetical protein VFJ16_31285 [Longimicrobium sp.]|nr:hypothetical protein [Longimicrobium sp.]